MRIVVNESRYVHIRSAHKIFPCERISAKLILLSLRRNSPKLTILNFKLETLIENLIDRLILFNEKLKTVKNYVNVKTIRSQLCTRVTLINILSS